jgi:type I restriction enzyme M protein
MLTGDIRGKIDAFWNAFWIGGICNPLEVIEQITYLLFLKRRNDLHTLDENEAARLKLKQLERRVFPAGKAPNGWGYAGCRWSRFKHFEAKELYEVVNDHVFLFRRPPAVIVESRGRLTRERGCGRV